jgi:pantetheine-phosphate adenylyltransferase
VIRVGLYAGSFDPLTFGHLHIMRTAAHLCDRLVIGIGTHAIKTPLFDAAERTALVRESTANMAKGAGCELVVRGFSGLTVDAARECEASMVIRGLRSGSDFDTEMELAGMNARLAPEIQTLFVPASPETRHITATLVRQIAAMGGDVSPFVPASVAKALQRRFAAR